MRRTMLLVLLAALAAAPYAVGGEPGESGPPEVIYVPRDQLDGLLSRHQKGVVLSVGDYLELWRAAKEGRFAPPSAPDTPAVVLGGTIAGRVEGDRVHLVADYSVRVLVDGLVRLPFPLGAAGISRATADDRAALLSSDGKATWLLLTGRGEHRVHLEMETKIERAEEVRSFRVLLPAGTALALDLLIPAGAEPLETTLDGGWRTESTDAGTRVLAWLPPRAGFSFAFRPRRELDSRTALLTARERVLHTVGARVLRTVALVEVTAHRRGVRKLDLALPKGVVVTDVVAPGLSDWGVGDGGKLSLVFRRETAGTVPVVLKGEETLSGPGELALPEVHVLGAAEERGIVAVRFESGVTGRIAKSDGYARIAVPPPPGGKAAPRAAAEPILAGADAAYRFWSATRSLGVRTEEPKGVVDCDVTVALTLGGAARDLYAEFRYLPRGEPVFALSPALPPLYELESVKVDAPVASRWEKTDDGHLAISLPPGSPPGREIRVSVHARLVSEAWTNSRWEETSFPLPALSPGVSGWTEGRILVFAAEQFEVKDGGLSGLKPESVERLGQPRARLGYRWVGAAASGRLTVTRRPPKVTVRQIAVAAPGEKVVRYTAFLRYAIQRAGVRRFAFTVSGGYGDRLNVHAPGGAEPVRHRQPDGTDLFEVTLPDRVKGEVLIVLTLEEEMAEGEGGREFAFPRVTALDVDDATSSFALESGENMQVEVTAAEGLRRIGLADAAGLFPDGFRPGRGLLDAWQEISTPSSLAFRVVRYADHPVLTAFVRDAKIVSVVAEDGTVRSRAVYHVLNAGRQSLTVRLPRGSVLWGSHVDGRPVKPARGEDGYLVPLRSTATEKTVEVRLVYESPGLDLGASGTLDLAAPELVGVPGAQAEWEVWLPSEYRILESGGVFAAPRSRPASPWLFRTLGRLRRTFARATLGGKETAAPAGSAAGPSPQADGRTVIRSYLSDKDQDALDIPRDRNAAGAAPPAPPESKPAPAEAPSTPPAEAPSTPPATGAEEEAEGGTETGGPVYRGPSGEVPPANRNPAEPGPPEGATPALPARTGRVGALPIDIDLLRGGTGTRARAIGVRGTLRLTYVDEPARRSLAWFLSVLTVVVGLVVTGQLRRRSPRRGFRIPPLVYLVGLGALATFAPAWFGVRDPALWDGIARGVALTLPALIVVRGIRRLAGFGRPAGAAVAALLLLAALASPAFAGGAKPKPAAPAAPAPGGDKVYVPYDPDDLGSLDSAGKVFLPFERFRELWNAAHPERRIEKPAQAPVPWLLTGAGYEGTAGDDAAELTARYDLVVLAEGWVEVAVPLAPAVVEEAKIDGEPVRVMTKGGRYVLLLTGKGAHRVELSLRIGLAHRGDLRALEMAIPAVPQARLVLTLPHSGMQVDLAGPAAPEVAGAKVTALLGPSGHLSLEFHPKSEAPSMGARVTAETREALSALEGRVELRMRTEWRVVSGGVTSLGYDLAGDFELVSVKGADVKAWRSDKGHLTVDLGREVKDATTVELVLLRSDGLRSRTVGIPGVAPVGVVRERGVLAVAASPDLRISTGAPRNLERVSANPGDYPGLVAEDAVLHSAWRFVLRPLALLVTTEPVRSEVRAEISAQHLVGREWLTSVATFRFEVRGDGAFEFPVTVPAGTEIVSVTGKGLARWWRDGDRLVFATGNPVRGALSVEVEFRRRLDPDAVRVDLPELHAIGAERESGSILVAHRPELSLTLKADDALVKEDVAAYSGWHPIDPAQENAYAWREDGSPYRLAVARSFPEARVRPVSTTRLQVLDDGVVVDAHFAFTIENAGEDTFRVFFPKGEGRDPIVLAERTRAVSFADAEVDGRPGRILTISLQQPATGAYDFRVVYEKKLARADGGRGPGTVEISGPEPLGENATSWVLVENQSSGEVTTGSTGGLDRAEATRAPYLPRGLDPRLIMAALRGRGAAWSLSLSLVIHDFAAFPDAKVSSAEILVAVGRDGWTLSRATWRVLNRTLQFLEISLPEGSTLEAVRAGGAAVKPGEKVVGGVTHILVPLSRMQPGDVSTTVDVYWSRRLTGTKPGGSIADLGELDIPEPKLYGFDVEQTFYTVRLPEGLSATFDGNMQPVDQAKIQLFKAEEGLRELERLNDVQSRGSFGQKVLATENYRSKRAEVEQTLAALERETRKVSQEEKLEKLRTKAGLLDETNAVQTESGLNLGEEGADKKQLLDQVQELAQNRRAQESFRGKSNVVTQSWARNSAAPQRQSEKQVEAGKSDDWRIAYLRLEAGNAPGQSAVTGGAATDDGGRAPNIGGAGGGSGGASWYRGATAIPALRPEAKAGLLSLPVTVPEAGQVFRFQKLDGGARLTVSVSGPGAGRGATAFFLFLLVVLGLVAFYRFRPHERYRAFAPSCLIAAGILLGILIPAGVLLVLSVLVVIAGGVWLYRAVRPAKEEVAEGA